MSAREGSFKPWVIQQIRVNVLELTGASWTVKQLLFPGTTCYGNYEICPRWLQAQPDPCQNLAHHFHMQKQKKKKEYMCHIPYCCMPWAVPDDLWSGWLTIDPQNQPASPGIRQRSPRDWQYRSMEASGHKVLLIKTCAGKARGHTVLLLAPADLGQNIFWCFPYPWL